MELTEVPMAKCRIIDPDKDLTSEVYNWSYENEMFDIYRRCTDMRKFFL